MQRLDPSERTFDEDVSTPNHSPSTCPECDGTVSTSDIETVCVDCGLVIDEDPVDRGPEWRSFEDNKQRAQSERMGAPLTAGRHDRGLSTEIGHVDIELSLGVLAGRVELAIHALVLRRHAHVAPNRHVFATRPETA